MDHWRNQKENKKIPRNKSQWKHNDPKPMGCSKSSCKREVYSNTILPQETRKISNEQPNLTPKATRDRTNVTQRVEGKISLKIRAEINVETKKIVAKIHETKR